MRKDPAESGRDRSHCQRQFTSASNQQLAAQSKCFKHYADPFSASHINRKLCYKPHNFVPIYLPTPVCVIINRIVQLSSTLIGIYLISMRSLFYQVVCLGCQAVSQYAMQQSTCNMRRSTRSMRSSGDSSGDVM